MDAYEWANSIFGSTDLGDSRRTDRLVNMVGAIVSCPESTLSKAFARESSNKGAQRFFSNKSISNEDITLALIDNTFSQMKKKERIFLIQDTSHLNYDGHSETKGLGHIGSTRDRSFQGIMMHWTMALDEKANPLGLAHLKLWERVKNPRKLKVQEHQIKPIEKKESYKWLEAVEFLDGRMPEKVQPIWVADRESDIFEFMDCVTQRSQDFVIRSNNNRIILDEEKLLRERVKKAAVIGRGELEVLTLQRKKRRILVEFKSCKVTLKAQGKRGAARSKHVCNDQEIYGVQVKSMDSRYKLEWLLLTTLEVVTLKDIEDVIWIYRQRWQIENLHKTLKSGFLVENIRLNSAAKLERAIILLLSCALRVYSISRQQRKNPNNLASDVLSKTECALISKINHKRKDYVPTIKEAWLWIGYLGGFRGSKNSSPPGQITFWRGFTVLQNLAKGATMMAGN